jgi:hypothetical protein
MKDNWLGDNAGPGGDASVGGPELNSALSSLRISGASVRQIFFSIIFFSAIFVSAIFLLIISVSCTSKSGAPLPDAVTRLQLITAADASKFPSPSAKHWSNPYLVIRADNVRLLTDVAANEEQVLKPGEVLNALAQLPAAAWPYGRAVAILVDESKADSEQDKAALRRNRGIVEGELEDAHVAIHSMASD